MSIADGVLGCANAFRKLQASLAERGLQADEKREANRAFTTKVNDCFERFQLWSSNLGAHRRDKSSLDQRLWEASHLRYRVLEYLKDLQQGLADASAIVDGVRIPWDEVSISSSEEDDDDAVQDTTELEQLASYISNTIRCLLRISMVIQKPAPHDRFIKSGRFDQSFRQPWDEQHIRDKFVNVPEWLTGRLGKAISRRRQFLEYRKTHYERIVSLGISNVPEDTGTVVSSLPTMVKQDQGLRASAITETIEPDNKSETGVSETSYAETIAGENALFVPKMPEGAQGGAIFECPYCFMIIGGIHSRSEWKRHVFTDLQPYICLHRECVSADETFARRHIWIDHEIYCHLKIWKCNLGCNQIFSSENDMRDHFAKVHGFKDHTDAHLLALSIQVQPDIHKQLSCPLCHDKISSLRRYYKHVARHLEQLALFAIPRDSLEDEDIENDVEDDDNKDIHDNIEDDGNEDKEDRASIASTGQGSRDGASEELEIETSKTQLGADHPNTLASMANLALTYFNQGRLTDAEALQVQVMETRKTQLGVDHPDTLASMTYLALTYSKQGRLTDAEALEVQVMETRKTKLGVDHPDTLVSMASLALTYFNQERWTDAEALQVQVMETRKTKLGVDHPDTLASMTYLALTYFNQGRLTDAEALQVQVIETHKTKLGVDHPSTLASIPYLALTYFKQGRRKDAEALQVQVMEIQKTKLGVDHPNTLASMANLASTYFKQGRWKDVEALQVQVMEIQKTKLGVDHPNTLASMANLASTYCNQGRWKDAEALQVQAMEIRKTQLGADHPSTLASMENLASTYLDQGRWEAAKALLEHVVKVRETTLAETHPHRLASQNNLAKAYEANGQTKEAVGLLEHIAKVQETTLKEIHPDLQVSERALAHMQSRIESHTT